VTRIVVTGYASLDYVVHLDGVPTANRATRIVERSAWPRLGGSPAYVAAALVAAGEHTATPVTWIGKDTAGETFLAGLREAGIASEGVAVNEAGRTPVSVLAYQPDGGCICFYDPGLDDRPTLTAAQWRLVAEAEWVCVTAGPASVTDEVLAMIRERTRLVWVVKADPKAFPSRLAARLAARADVISASESEAAFIAEAIAASSPRSGRIRVATRGSDGASVSWRGKSIDVSASPVTGADPTGAGDTFVGGLIAALARTSDDPPGAVEAGIAAAERLLRSRISETETAG
jgi:ribokinase